jgi:tetratricopeptide (TPR) repeat protein
MHEGAYDEKHSAVAVALVNMGAVLNALGQYEEAKRHLERALRIQ